MPTRPRPRDAQATRTRLLEEATRAFAEKGFDGARIDDVADRAAVNKRMIYAYFGDKDGLYRAVLDAHLARALDLAKPDERVAADPRAQAAGIIRRYFEFLAAHRDFVRLLSWEALSKERRARAILLDRIAAGLEPLHDVIRRGVREGAFRRDLEPRHVVASVNALFIGYFLQESLLEALGKTNLRAPAARAAALERFVRLVLDGIGAQP
jgi:TetR/AcrR family transcriptional regulator